MSLNVKLTMCLTCLLLACNGNTGIWTAHSDGVLSLNPETVRLALNKPRHMATVVVNCLEGDPVGLTVFLVSSDVTSSSPVRPLPFQPHLCFVSVSVVKVLRWPRGIWKTINSLIEVNSFGCLSFVIICHLIWIYFYYYIYIYIYI